MSSRRPETRPAPHARLPCAFHDLHILHSTVDAYGRAHWLLAAREPDRQGTDPYDAVVVTVDGGTSYETQLSAVRPRLPRFDALPDGGFVLADARSPRDDEHVQVFDALGRPSWTFRVGDGIEHLLADEAGDLWVGYFDEGVLGDALSAAGVRKWDSTGKPLWEYRPAPGADSILDCYALNVDRHRAWVYPYTRFPLLEVRGHSVVRERSTPVRGATGVAVHGDRVAFLGGYREEGDQLAVGELTETSVERVERFRLVSPEGGVGRRRRLVCRGPRIYVQPEPFTTWEVLDVTTL